MLTMDNERTLLSAMIECPLWPKRDELPELAWGLYDDIAADAKKFLIFCHGRNSTNEWANPVEALAIITKWSSHIDPIMDTIRVDETPSVKMLLEVFRHYINQFCDWSKLR